MNRLPILSQEPTRRSRAHDLLGLTMFLIVCLVVSGIGGAVTAESVGSWYQTLSKPAFNPPDWVFAPVWTTLYVVMAVAAWRVWRSPPSAARARGLVAFAIQLALNLSWSIVFFGWRQIGLALADIAILLTAIVVTTILFWRIERLAGALLVPYLLWVGYAGILNYALWRLN